jgi:hypothetical protein
MSAKLHTVDSLVTTSGFYAGIFDLASEAHAGERLISGMKDAQAQAEAAGRSWATIFYFNQQIIDRANVGQILAWTMLFDGTFLARVDVVSPDEELVLSRDLTRNFLGHESHDLVCLSGRIAVASLDRLGDVGLRPVLEVPPGVYRVGVKVVDHPVGSASSITYEHAAGEGPDWFISMKKIADAEA